ncbi:MAG: hypothetical protein NC548_39685 [Lachnospiraceae bacterium]|nr:hypothetical protein [Lachnospiraceae bacterium]
MTNADWIRGMTDEELYRNVIAPCSCHATCIGCLMLGRRGKCMTESEEDAVMDWLESEHGEE